MSALPFIKLYPSVIKKTKSLSAAAIFGRMHGYAKQNPARWICYASKEKLSEELGLSYSTILRGIGILQEHKYIEDLTPALRNAPHRYKINIAFLENISVEEVPTPKNPDDSEYVPDDGIDTMGLSADEMMGQEP